MASTRLGNYTVHYNNLEEYHYVKRELFVDNTYYFETENPRPLIIDGGAHIGLATLYFKKMFPDARIIAIEPNPTSFKLLEQNVWENNLQDVECVNAALIDDDRPFVTLYEDVTKDWLITSSLHEGAWSGEQKTQPVTVSACRLQTFLDQPVDLLKLDIEGAEQKVLHGITTRLGGVKRLRMEFHATVPKSLKAVLAMLAPHFETLEVTKKGVEIEDPAQFLGLCFISGDKAGID